MTDDRIPDGDGMDEALGRALRRADAEARPRAEFRDALREGFVEGRLPVPAEDPAPDPAPAEGGGFLRVPRWLAYPAAAAVLLAALAGISALSPRAVPEDPILADPPPTPADAALTAAERRLAADPVLGGRTWQRRIVEGRPWLFPAEAVAADAGEVAAVSRSLAKADRLMDAMLPSVAARPCLPVVAVVAPTRAAFESLAAPLVDPMPIEETMIALALAGPRVLLVSPETLAPGGEPCEEMDLLHEAAHAWLHVRKGGTAPLPLWVEEGLAGVVAMPGPQAREWSRRTLADVRGAGLDPFDGERLFLLGTYGDAARRAAEVAPCEERPYILLYVFNCQGESLVEFLLDAGAGADRPARFGAWLHRVLDGHPATPEDTAEALGFGSPEALLAARDAWMGL